MISRFTRLFSLVLTLVILSTLYIFYPTSESAPPSPGDPVYKYEAGGIDSDHYNAEIKPDFSKDEPLARFGGNIEEGGVIEHEEVRGVFDDDNGVWIGSEVRGGRVDEKVLGGSVIMPKLENATAK